MPNFGMLLQVLLSGRDAHRTGWITVIKRKKMGMQDSFKDSVLTTIILTKPNLMSTKTTFIFKFHYSKKKDMHERIWTTKPECLELQRHFGGSFSYKNNNMELDFVIKFIKCSRCRSQNELTQ